MAVAGACSRSVPELIHEAREYQAKGDLSAAIIDLKNALDQDPANVEAHQLIGVIYADAGALLDAEKELHKALELGVAPDQIMPVLGRVLVEMERYKQTLAELSPAAQKTAPPAQVQAQLALLRGRAFLGLGNMSDAKTQFYLAAVDNPVDSKLGLAQVAAKEGDSKAAYRLVEEVLTTSPNSAEAWFVKGDILRSQSNNQAALAAYQQAVKLRPSFVLAHLSLAVQHIGAGKYDDARAEIAIARKFSPASPMLHFTLALLAMREQDYESCRANLQYVFQVIPQHMPSTLLSGTLFFALGQLEQAQNAFTAYLSAFPGNVYTRKMLAATLLRKAQPQSAVEALDPLLKYGLQDAELFSLAGQAYLQVGQVRKARDYLEKAVALNPASAKARTTLGMTRFASGDRQGAVAELQSAIELDPFDSRAENFLVMALIVQNDTDKALQVLSSLEKRRPNDLDTHMLKGAVYIARQQFADARASYEHALKLRPGYFPAAAALGQLDLRDNKPAAARERMESVLRHDKGNLDATLSLARLESDAGRRAEAVGWINRALSEHPEALQAYLLLAQVQLQSGEAKDAVSAARQARDMNPKDPRAVEVLGRAQLAAGDKSGAITSFTTLTGMLPRSAPVQLLLASAYQANGEIRQAAAVVRRALDIDPANVEAKVTLGGIYLQTNRLRDAIDMALQIEKQHPQAPQGYALEGDAMMAEQNYARAAKAYEKADSLQGAGLTRIRLHQAQSMAQKAQATDTLLLEWVKQHPDDVDVRLYLGDLYIKTGKSTAAIEQYEALLKYDPKNFRVLNNISWAMQQAGDPRAVDYAQRAFQERPNDAIIADTLGWTLVGLGKLYEGVQVMFKAVALDPGNPEIRFHLAQALVKAGDSARARNELKILLASKKPYAQADEARALLNRLSP